MENQEKLLTVEQVAKYLQLNPSVVRRKLRAGEIKGRKLGRLWRVKKEDLKHYVGDPNIDLNDISPAK